MTPSKALLRQQFRAIRREAAKNAQAAAREVARHLQNHPRFQQATHIGCYLAIDHEMPTMPIIETIWQANKLCCLPVLNKNRTLNFTLFKREDALAPNAFNILEPVNRQIVALSEITLLLLPLLAFDRHGTRLGTGGGYYDRTLAKNSPNRPLYIGLGYAAQEAAVLPREAFDVPLDEIMTEQGLILCER